MGQTWNGLALQTELSTLLSDVSTANKARVLGWINDILDEICDSYDWAFMRKTGKKILTASTEEQDLFLTPPGAPTLAALAGGSLTVSTSFKVLVTFLEGVSGLESKAGTESAAIVTAGSDLSITVSAIPTSTSTLVTARRIYLQKAGGDWLLYSTLSDNTTTTTTITSEAASTARQPPEDHQFRKLDGDPFFTSSSIQLKHRNVQQMRLSTPGTFPSGTPAHYDMIGQNRIILLPMPSSALTLNFYYYKRVAHVVATAASVPEAPSWIRPALYAGVKWKGRDYRERDGRLSDYELYEKELSKLISKYGTPRKGPSIVRDTQGSIDGFER